jgi:hypothetical protein
MKKGFTEAQRTAIDKVMELVKEHFDAGLVVFAAETEDNYDITLTRFHGAAMTALGLSVRANDYLREPEEKQDDE